LRRSTWSGPSRCPAEASSDFRLPRRASFARAGIYDLASYHDNILVPVVLRHWGIADLTGLSAPAEKAAMP